MPAQINSAYIYNQPPALERRRNRMRLSDDEDEDEDEDEHEDDGGFEWQDEPFVTAAPDGGAWIAVNRWSIEPRQPAFLTSPQLPNNDNDFDFGWRRNQIYRITWRGHNPRIKITHVTLSINHAGAGGPPQYDFDADIAEPWSSAGSHEFVDVNARNVPRWISFQAYSENAEHIPYVVYVLWKHVPREGLDALMVFDQFVWGV
ncbi:MAG: hypothetical protein M1833_000928 [Piccolia ochrophora]|nr:MAG: hypothetical protein M1833_000928 [Piccolia ochrophora]